MDSDFLVTRKKVLVAGGGGFIGGHLARRLKRDGNYVVVAGRKPNEFMAKSDICDEFLEVDLRELDHCIRASKGCQHVYNLAADMGGMGFIESNQSVLMWNNTLVSSNVLEAARRNGAERYLYSSTACVYNEDKQTDPRSPGLKESDAWPAKPQEVYGLEKLYHEEIALAYARDFGLVTRIARFYNVYGPFGTWKGGREKVPAAFCRKAITSTTDFEIWGDGEQTRSFIYVDDCVEGILRVMMSDYPLAVNLGMEEMISMTTLQSLPCPLSTRLYPSDTSRVQRVCVAAGATTPSSANRLGGSPRPPSAKACARPTSG